MKLHIIVLALLALVGGSERAYTQNFKWKIAAPSALIPGRLDRFSPTEFGAIAAKGRVVLAGWQNLVLSMDAGVTWRNLTAPYPTTDFAMEVAIFDDNTYALVSYYSGAYLSTDQGFTWTNIQSTGAAISIVFDGSANRVATMLGYNLAYDIIVGGITTKQPLNASYSSCIRVAADNSLRVLGSSNGNTAALFSSYDHGITWTRTSTLNDGDDFSFLADQVDPKRFVTVNENWVAQNGNNSNLYLTTDNGSSWTTVYSQPRGNLNALCGNGTTGCHDYFVGTVSTGVLRSNDKGLTWNLIGGPPMTLDSRSIAATDDSLIFIIDTFGNIWASNPTNYGPGSSAITGAQYFTQLTLSGCDTTVEGTITFFNSLCQKYDITSIQVIGKDSLEYTLTGTLTKPTIYPDSVRVRFTPTKGGKSDAKLVVTYSNGGSTTLDISVNVTPSPLALSESTLFANDTISLCDSDTSAVTASVTLSSKCPLSHISVSILGTDSTSFAIQGKKTVLLPNDSLIKVLCIPQHIGSLSARLHIVSDDGRTWDIPLGLFVRVTPFEVHAPADRDTVSLCNLDSIRIILSAPCALDVSSLALSGTDSDSFSLGNKNTATLPRDSILWIGLVPKHGGDLSATLTITTIDGRIIRVPIGAHVLPTTLSLTPQTLFVGDTINLCTRDSARINLHSICPESYAATLQGTDAASFGLGISPLRSLPQDSGLIVYCNPAHSGMLDALVAITDAGGGTYTVPIHIFVTPASLSVAPVVQFRHDTILSCAGDSGVVRLIAPCALEIASMNFTGSDSASFVIDGSGSPKLPMDSLVRVVVMPQHSGRIHADLHITSHEGSTWDVPMNIFANEPPLLFSPAILFAGDTLEPCEARTDSLLLTSICPLSIVAATISGADSSSFSINGKSSLILPNDSMLYVHCLQSHAGSLSATLHLVSSGGTRWDIPLSAFAKSGSFISFDPISFTNISTDVIGEDISIPIIIHHGGTATSGQFEIRYDSTALIYHGVFDAPGTDHTIWQHQNISARVGFNTSGDSILMARFSFYPVDSLCTRVDIDSLVGIAGQLQCLSVPIGAGTVDICSTVGCGRTILSKFVRYGTSPELALSPNPGKGVFTLRSSNPLGMTRITIVDELGQAQWSSVAEITPTHALKLNLEHLPSGTYFVHVGGIITLTMRLEK